MKAVIDEDLPRSFGEMLQSNGWEVYDVRDHGLRSHTDAEIFRFAINHHAVLFSADLGFANTITFPLGTHGGMCVLRFPNEMPTRMINTIVIKLLGNLTQQDIDGNLIIFTPHNFRIRRKM